MINLGILISGRGSNMEAIIRGVRERNMPARVSVVISSRADADGLDIAANLGIKTRVIPSRGFSGSRDEYDSMIADALEEHGVTKKDGLVCLAGFMRVLGSRFVKRYRRRIINIHPSLLPSFPGLDAQRQALEHGAKYTGCTVHFVDEGVDTGPIIIQVPVPIIDDDTKEVLSARILKEEHAAYVKAVELFALEKIRIAGNRTIIG